jgi:hypothetical protein
MANKFNGLLDSIANGALSPKGNLGDWQHASRLYIDNNMRLAPRSKFNYHVQFVVTPEGQSLIPKLLNGAANNEIGMLVKNATLPSYSSNIEQKKKYNRIKNVQTGIQYEPCSITFHDDNQGLTTAFLQAYYRYYFADGNQRINGGRAYAVKPHNTYKGEIENKFKYGMDVNNPGVPFFKEIRISTMARGEYITYTLVNPLLTAWSHDDVSNADGAGTLENKISIAYEAVFYESGAVETGSNGDPAGFGQDHYDTTPSPLSLAGGGGGGLAGAIDGAFSLYDFIASGDVYENPLLGVLMGANLIGNVRNLSKEGIRQEGFNLLTGALGAATGTNVSGVAQTLFPKNGGSGGSKNLLLAVAGVGLATAVTSSKTFLRNNPAALDSAMQKQAVKNYQRDTGGTVAQGQAAYEALRSNPNEMQALENSILGGR